MVGSVRVDSNELQQASQGLYKALSTHCSTPGGGADVASCAALAGADVRQLYELCSAAVTLDNCSKTAVAMERHSRRPATHHRRT